MGGEYSKGRDAIGGIDVEVGVEGGPPFWQVFGGRMAVAAAAVVRGSQGSRRLWFGVRNGASRGRGFFLSPPPSAQMVGFESGGSEISGRRGDPAPFSLLRARPWLNAKGRAGALIREWDYPSDLCHTDREGRISFAEKGAVCAQKVRPEGGILNLDRKLPCTESGLRLESFTSSTIWVPLKNIGIFQHRT